MSNDDVWVVLNYLLEKQGKEYNFMREDIKKK